MAELEVRQLVELTTEPQRRAQLQAFRRHDGVVYARTPLAGAGAVLDCLSRATHRTAIGNERRGAITGDKVLLRVRADATGGKRTIALDGHQFIGRLLRHVLPGGFKRIRHDGLLAPATMADRLAAARALLAMPAPIPKAIGDAQAFMRRVAAIEISCCPHCGLGRMQLIQHLVQLVQRLPADRAELATIVPRAVACGGPP